MLYYLLRPMVRIGLKLFLREIHISNVERIPKDKPVILAANHPTGFIEPCILACFQKRSMYFLARGSLFGKRFYDLFLSQVHILPVYRLKDRGYAYVKNNYSTFETCYEALGKNKMIMILAEGTSIHEKRLRPLVKGTGRIALGALEQNPNLEDVYIVPVGVNYTHAERFWSDLYVDIGEPVSSRQFMADYEENPNKGVLSFTRTLRSGLLERVIHIDNPDDDEGVEVLLELTRPNTQRPTFPVVKSTNEQLYIEKKLVDRVNLMAPADKHRLWATTKHYQTLLDAQKIDENVVKSIGGNRLLLFILLPIYLLGFLLSAPPFLLAKYIVDTKTKHIEFYSSVLLAGSFGLYGVYWVGIVGCLAWLGSHWWLWAMILLPLLTVFRLYYGGYWKDYINKQKWEAIPADKKQELLDIRSQVIEMYGQITGSFPFSK